MAFSSVENFDSYSTGVSIDTLNSGSGWSGAWAKGGSGTATIETAPAGGQGGNALKVTGTVAVTATRTFAGISAGTIRFRARLSSNTPDNQVLFVVDSKMYVQFDADGNIKLYNGGTLSYQTIQAYSADTWYTIDIDFDDATQDNAYRVRVNEGAYTSWVNTNGTYTTVGNIQIAMDAQSPSLDFWIDDITTPSAVTSSIKTFNGLAYASTKTVDGVAIASVKNFNGLA